MLSAILEISILHAAKSASFMYFVIKFSSPSFLIQCFPFYCCQQNFTVFVQNYFARIICLEYPAEEISVVTYKKVYRKEILTCTFQIRVIFSDFLDLKKTFFSLVTFEFPKLHISNIDQKLLYLICWGGKDKKKMRGVVAYILNHDIVVSK